MNIILGYLDIECYQTENNSMPNPQINPITCISISYNNHYTTLILDDINFESTENNHTIIHCEKESDIISKLYEIMIDIDIIILWNAPFDLEYIEMRAKVLKVYWNLNGINTLDLLMCYRYLYRRPSYRLKDVVIYENITSQDEEKVNYGKLWEEDKPKLIERNLKHVKWIESIDSKLKISDYEWQMKELCGLESLDGIEHTSVIIETMLLRNSQQILPTKGNSKSETFEGAYVMSPKSGIFSNVAEFDFSKYYPSILLSEKLEPAILYHFKIEHPGTIDWDKYKEFAQNYKGPCILMDLVKDLIRERARLEKTGHIDKIATIKAVLNATYGNCASPHFRLFDVDLAARITEVARNTTQAVIEDIKKIGYNVLYSDTDSIWVEISKEELVTFTPKINEIISKYGDFSIKLEDYFTSVLFTGAKKRYACLSDKGILHFTGFERVKSDSSNITRMVQETAIRMALENRKNEIIPYIKKVIAEIKNAPITDIAISKQLSKNLDEYTGPQINYIKELRDSELKVKAGDSVKIVPVKNSKTGVFVYQDDTDIPSNIQVNYEEIIRIQIKSKIKDILEVCGLELEDTSGQVKLF